MNNNTIHAPRSADLRLFKMCRSLAIISRFDHDRNLSDVLYMMCINLPPAGKTELAQFYLDRPEAIPRWSESMKQTVTMLDGLIGEMRALAKARNEESYNAVPEAFADLRDVIKISYETYGTCYYGKKPNQENREYLRRVERLALACVNMDDASPNPKEFVRLLSLFGDISAYQDAETYGEWVHVWRAYISGILDGYKMVLGQSTDESERQRIEHRVGPLIDLFYRIRSHNKSMFRAYHGYDDTTED